MDTKLLIREEERVEDHNKRARERGLTATLELSEWIRTLDHFQWACAYCMGSYEVLEHFISLELQGGTCVTNCLPACFFCNARKGAIHPGALSWLTPSTLLYIRAYFASLSTGKTIVSRNISTATIQERPDAIYTIKDIISKFKITHRTVNRLMRSGEIQGVMIQGKWRFGVSDIAGLASTTNFFTLQEAAAQFKLSYRTLQRWIDSGEMKAIYIGRQIRIEEEEIKRHIAGLASTTNFFTLQEAAAQLNVCERTVFRWIESEQIEAVSIGRSIRIEEKEVKRHKQRKLKRSSTEIATLWS